MFYNSKEKNTSIIDSLTLQLGFIKDFKITLNLLTLSCLKKHNIFNSRKTLLQETKFWKTLGIFLSATLFPSRGSVTDLQNKRFRTSHTTVRQFFQIRKEYFRLLIILSLDGESKQCEDTSREKSIQQRAVCTALRVGIKWSGSFPGEGTYTHRRARAHPCVCCTGHCSSKLDQHPELRSGCDDKQLLHLPQKDLDKSKTFSQLHRFDFLESTAFFLLS